MKKSIYQQVKKQNGEAFAQSIRRFDSALFEMPNFLNLVKYAGRNALTLLDFLSGLKQIQHQHIDTGKTPFELLDEAGYDAFVADTIEKQNSIQYLFDKNERLCTFHDMNRFKDYYIIHAVKRGARNLNRADFKGKEDREDEYGTSVISIQVLKDGGSIKICNRYNHTVDNPDNTFNSNPDNIIAALSCAIEKYFNVRLEAPHVDIPNGFVLQNGQIYQYYLETGNVFFGNGYYLKDGDFHSLDTGKTVQFEQYILDLKERRIWTPVVSYFPEFQKKQELIDILSQQIQSGQLQVRKNGDDKSIYVSGEHLLTLRNGRLVALTTKKDVPFSVLVTLKQIEEVDFLNTTTFENDGMFRLSLPATLKKVYLPKVVKVDYHLFDGKNMLIKAEELEKQGVVFVGSLAFDKNKKQFLNRGCYTHSLISYLNQVMYEKQERVLFDDKENKILIDKKPFVEFEGMEISALYLNDMECMGYKTIYDMKGLKHFEAKNLKEIESDNFANCDLLEELNLPAVEVLGKSVVKNIRSLKNISMPRLKKCDDFCFFNIFGVNKMYMPNLEEMGNNCISNTSVDAFLFPVLKKIGDGCFFNNTDVEELLLPELEKFGMGCFKFMRGLKRVSLPKANSELLDGTFYYSKLKVVDIPCVPMGYNTSYFNNFDLEYLSWGGARKICSHQSKVLKINSKDYVNE